MPNSLKSSGSEPENPADNAQLRSTAAEGAPQGWVRVGAIAAASAVLGGLAAAWYYRKALTQLREAGSDHPDSPPVIQENETEEDF